MMGIGFRRARPPAAFVSALLLASALGEPALAQAPAKPPTPPQPETCATCHSALVRRKVVHQAMEMQECRDCHQRSDKPGKCKSAVSTGWKLGQETPDLCYGCHDRMDYKKGVHTAVRMGACIECHDVHSSDLPRLAKKPREQLCFTCHEPKALFAKPVRHAPVVEGRCLDCHDPHVSGPARTVATGSRLCLKCHDAKAPVGKGTPAKAKRVDLAKAVVHGAITSATCQDCHEGGHSGANPKLLKKAPVELCRDCHVRKDTAKHVHAAVREGECAVCHDPHSSARPKLLAAATDRQLCFSCHHDDITGRAVVHSPVAEGGCMDCHDPHGAANRFALKLGDGKELCYSCHDRVDDVKVRHPALDRYGCTGCHDPHAAGNPYLLARPVNAVCKACHADVADGLHATAMVAGGHLIDGPVDPRRTGHRFSCASCHAPHGSNDPKLFYFGQDAVEMCDGCHGDRTGKHPELKDVTSKVRSARAAGPEAGARSQTAKSASGR